MSAIVSAQSQTPFKSPVVPAPTTLIRRFHRNTQNTKNSLSIPTPTQLPVTPHMPIEIKVTQTKLASTRTLMTKIFKEIVNTASPEKLDFSLLNTVNIDLINNTNNRTMLEEYVTNNYEVILKGWASLVDAITKKTLCIDTLLFIVDKLRDYKDNTPLHSYEILDLTLPLINYLSLPDYLKITYMILTVKNKKEITPLNNNYLFKMSHASLRIFAQTFPVQFTAKIDEISPEERHDLFQSIFKKEWKLLLELDNDQCTECIEILFGENDQQKNFLGYLTLNEFAEPLLPVLEEKNHALHKCLDRYISRKKDTLLTATSFAEFITKSNQNHTIVDHISYVKMLDTMINILAKNSPLLFVQLMNLVDELYEYVPENDPKKVTSKEELQL